jgi:hypothetical protein
MENAAKGVRTAFQHDFTSYVSGHGLHVIINTFEARSATLHQDLVVSLKSTMFFM